MSTRHLTTHPVDGFSAADGAWRLRTAEQPYARWLAAAWWLALGVVGLALDSLIPEAEPVRACAWLSALATAFGLWVFWRHGGGQITAIGIYNFSFALFVGFAGLYNVATSPPGTSLDSLPSAVAWCYFLHVMTWLLFWAKEQAPVSNSVPDVDPAAARWAVRLGVFTLVAAVLVPPLGVESALLASAAGFVGTALLGVGLIRGPYGHRWLLCGAAIGVAFAVYAHYLFNGFGRIVLGSLGFGLLIVLAQRNRGMLVKSVVLVGATPVLIALAKLRVQTVEQMHPSLEIRQTGLESVVSPLRSFATLLSYNDFGLLPREWGKTFWAALVVAVPRDWWPGKPIGFGAELVPFISPSLVGTGQSEAALFFSEWLVNFGLPGLLLMVPVAGLAIRGLDRLLARARCLPLDSGGAVVRYTMAVVGTTGVIDIVWVGTFGYTSRTVFRLLILAVIFAVFAGRKEPAPPRLRAAARRPVRHRRRARRA
jgi:hypothetical protein